MNILSLKINIFALALLTKLRKDVCSSINIFLTIINLVIIIKVLLDLTNLTKAQTFYIYKLTKAVIVRKDKKLIFIVFQVVFLGFQSFNNS